MLEEEELLVDPEFFYLLKDALPRVSHVEIAPKRGRSLNELTKFRYQVILRIGDSPEYLEPDQWFDWRKESLSLERLRERLRADAGDYLAIEGVPNQRIARELALLNAVNNPLTPSLTVAASLRANLPTTDHQGIETDALDGLAEQLGYRTQISWARQHRRVADVVFWRLKNPALAILPNGEIDRKASNWSRYGNNPLRRKAGQLLTTRLREYLQKKLPSYMVPAAIV